MISLDRFISGELNATILKKFATYLGSSVFANILPFLVMPLIANALTPEDFGKISNFGVLVSILVPFISLQQPQYIQASYFAVAAPRRREMVSNVIYLMLIFSAALFFLLFFFGGVIERNLLIPASWAHFSIIVALGSAVFLARTTVLRLEGDAKNYARFNIGYKATSSLLTLLFIVGLGMPWTGYVTSSASSSFVFVALTIYFIWRSGSMVLKPIFTESRAILNFGVPLLLFAVTPLLRRAADKVIITKVIGLSENGVYSLAFTFAVLFEEFTKAVYSTYVPRMYKELVKIDPKSQVGAGKEKLGKEAQDKVRVSLVKEAYLIFVAILMGLFLGYFVMRVVIFNFLNSSYHGAVEYFSYLLVFIFLKSLNYYFVQLVLYTKKTTSFSFSMFGTALVHLAISIALVGPFGIYGIVIGLLFSEVLKMVITLFMVQKRYNLPWLKFYKG